jgi:hypothetical protein
MFSYTAKLVTKKDRSHNPKKKQNKQTKRKKREHGPMVLTGREAPAAKRR